MSEQTTDNREKAISTTMRRSTGYGLLVITMAAICKVVSSIDIVHGKCKVDPGALATQCAKFVQKQGPWVPPSKECCDVIKGVDVKCLCTHITEGAKIISFKKAAFCCHHCGNPLPQGDKCGGVVEP